MAPEKILSTLKRPGCSVVRLSRTRASSPLSMFFISRWLENKKKKSEKGFFCYCGLQRNRSAKSREISKIRWLGAIRKICKQHSLVNGHVCKCLCGFTCSLHTPSVSSSDLKWKRHTAPEGSHVFTLHASLS